MEHLVRDPDLRSRVYHLKAEGMAFKVTVALRARRVEKWIRGVKRDFLGAATTKCVGLDCEFTDPRMGNQRVAVLQLSVASKTLVFQIIHADEVPQVLKDFLQDENIRFYGIHITSTHDLQKAVPNPTNNPIPSLYDLETIPLRQTLRRRSTTRRRWTSPRNKKKMNSFLDGPIIH
ncbi:uncharacterized protein [Lolium perenne]|uniref:uncharacterized protein n=1 Tax=Lolium perenne TaxID=4522 RepID=UPI0021F59570|nr:uncharacterized protein LOC127323310 [Lolium perenne]